MSKYYSIQRFAIAAMLALTIANGIAGQAHTKQPSKSNSVQSKVGGFFGRIVHEHKKVHVTVLGQKKSYTGFPPRLVVEKGTDRFDDLNLFVDVPDYPWMCTLPKPKGSRASMHFKSSKPKLEVFLDVDRANSKVGRAAMERSQKRLAQEFNCKFTTNTSQVEAAGMQGVVYEAYLGSTRSKKKLFLVWTASADGRDYRLTVAGKPGDASEIEKTMKEFLTRFRLISPVNVSRASRQENREILKVGAIQETSGYDSGPVQWASDTP